MSTPAEPAAESRRTRSLSAGMVDLALQLAKQPETVFDVVIVGSGYGGSVAAQQLSGLMTTDKGTGKPRKVSVCVLERGAEYLPGMFPSGFADLPGHLRYGMQGSGKVSGKHEGLFDIRMGADVSALVANGLGGGSLINAGVLLKPEFDTFNSALPARVCDALANRYLDEARELLLRVPLASGNRPNTIMRSALFGTDYPQKFHRIDDLRQKAVASSGSPAEISMAMTSQPASPASVSLAACNGCGDCMTGCNVGAKASLDTNLLAQAHQQGAQIYTGVSVLSLARQAGTGETADGTESPTWILDAVHTLPELRAREKGPLKIKALHVILAAGTLGSPEILMRSRSDRLSLSNTLGESFSCNGDNIAAVHGLKKEARGTANEHEALQARKVGPTITNMVGVRGGEAGTGARFWIQEFAVPAPLKRLFAELVTTGRTLARLQSFDGSSHGNEKAGDIDPFVVDDDAIGQTLLVGCIGHDDANGMLRLPFDPPAAGRDSEQQGTLQIVWPQARNGQQITEADKTLKALCKEAFPDALVISNPMWRLLPGTLGELISQPLGPVLTVHPLGGCVMADQPSDGVVNEYGQVFNLRSESESGVFKNLAVLDGSIIAGSLGANPSLAISALALRAIEQLRQDWQFFSDTGITTASLPARPIFALPMPAASTPPLPTVIEISERLWGHVELKNSGGKSQSFLMELTLTYERANLTRLMSLWGDRQLAVNPEKSNIRLFDSGLKDSDTRRFSSEARRFLSETEREADVVWQAPLSGSLRFLHRENSWAAQRIARGLWAYAINRGMRDVWQRVAQWIFDKLHPKKRATNAPETSAFKTIWTMLLDALHLASRAGEVRRFDYALQIGQASKKPEANAFPQINFQLLSGRAMAGRKRLTYDRRANPWQQLTTLTLTEMPLMAAGSNTSLLLDAQFMASQGVPLLRIASQQNHASALLDMASFGMFIARVLLNVHLWTFRKPDTPVTRTSDRLPGSIEGLPEPQITLLPVGKHRGTAQPVFVRLTRYEAKKPAAATTFEPLAPLAMIHGYSVSGNTFTHPSLKQSAADYFWHRGRDVWVIDLRTSSGLVTAALPWSIEEVALVDIPAALLHIKNACGGKVDVIAHCIGAAMLGMAVLTDARRIRNATMELGSDTWITPAQLGTLTAFNGDGGDGKPHPTIKSIVLSQKGPLLRYTEANIFRTYILRTLRRWLVPDGYRFKARKNPGVADQLIDRLLSSLPYPKADYDIENPRLPWKRTPWTSSRHRMDALYARDFAAGNLSGKTLDAIDDLFGPLNLDTVSQTMHFVRFSCVTNQRGRGEFASIDNLNTRWSGIPTLAIHGAQNGLVDVSTQDLLETNFRAASVPFQKKTYPDLEHQDAWIGKDSTAVFGDIESFLKTADELRSVPSPKAQAWHFEMPWIGPRLKRDGRSIGVHALSSPRFGDAYLVLVPISRTGTSGQRTRCAPVLVSACADSRNWVDIALPRNWLPDGNDVAGWLALVAYPRGQTTLQDASPAGSSVSPQVPNPPGSTGHDLLQTELDDWLASPLANCETCFVDRQDIQRQQHVSNLYFSFVLGSCQYPHGLMDIDPATESLKAIATMRNATGQLEPDFVLFTGDQIYADATAGLADATRSDERFDLPYETALQTLPMRDIMRRVPAYMLLDDHEFSDNWEPMHRDRRDIGRDRSRTRKQGLKAYWKYQRMQQAVTAGDRPSRVSFHFDHGCATFFMLDTRSDRHYRQPGDASTTAMFPAREMDRLKAWLKRDVGLVKFIVTPSILLPRRLGAIHTGHDHAARSDAWEGYPGNRDALLDFIAEHQVPNVVFLSGDEHLSCLATATLTRPQAPDDRSVKIASIHSSGLYAPFPFANSRQEDFVQGIDYFQAANVECQSQVSFNPPGSCFASISVDSNYGTPLVSVTFIVAGRRIEHPDVFNITSAAVPQATQMPGNAMPKAAAL
ncbi:MAG: alkaline phosphatase D family protein [Pseudomonadota bacterium]